MIEKFVKGRTFVFIDAANILYSQHDLGWRVGYEELKRYLETQCRLLRIYYYIGRMINDHKQTSFLHRLEQIGYVVRSKEVKRIKNGKSYLLKGNLDVELTIDVMVNMSLFDSMILLSGDSDFAPLLDIVKKNGKRTVVISTKGHVSRELLERAKYINLKKLKDMIVYAQKNPPAENAGRGMT